MMFTMDVKKDDRTCLHMEMKRLLKLIYGIIGLCWEISLSGWDPVMNKEDPVRAGENRKRFGNRIGGPGENRKRR